VEASANITSDPSVPSISTSAVLGESMEMPSDTPICKGYDFNNGIDLTSMLQSALVTGFQATNLGLAIEEVKKMRRWRMSDVPFENLSPIYKSDDNLQDIEVRKKIRAKIFLSFTSNQISCGQREVIRFLAQHKMVDVIVTTAGGVEEDIIKCLRHTYMGDFKLKGADLRKKGINRIGNLLVPNNNYCEFEDWLTPLLEELHDEQDQTGEYFTPSKIIKRLGEKIDNEESVWYWAAKNDIPVFCPALTDGSIGDMIYFQSYKRSGFVLDIAQDIRRINDEAVQAYATGMIILGGGVVKHHTCNANLMRNGADFSVFINTGQEFDGSDSGASPDEAISWGKVKLDSRPVKICADATIVFPLLVSQTFAKDVEEWKDSVMDTTCWIHDSVEN